MDARFEIGNDALIIEHGFVSLKGRAEETLRLPKQDWEHLTEAFVEALLGCAPSNHVRGTGYWSAGGVSLDVGCTVVRLWRAQSVVCFSRAVWDAFVEFYRARKDPSTGPIFSSVDDLRPHMASVCNGEGAA